MPRAVVILNHYPTKDGVAISKSFRFRDNTELDLGKLGYGDVEFTVAVKISIEASLDRVLTKQWLKNDEYGLESSAPMPEDAVRKAIERYLSSESGKMSLMDAIGEKL